MPNKLSIRAYIFLICGLIVMNLSIYQTIFVPHLLSVMVFEAGKGRAALVRSADGKTFLIDTGSDASTLRTLGTALPEWQRSLDGIVLTSANANSDGGLSEIAKRYGVPTLLRFGATPNSVPYGTTITFDKNSSVTIISPGTFSISDGAKTLLISSTTSPGTHQIK